MKFLTFCLLLLPLSYGKISQENQEIIRKWLPLYWLHSEEVFYPTNFGTYISQMELRDENGNVIDPNPTAEFLPTGEESRNLHLNTKTELSCVHCYDQALFGLPIDQVKSFNISNFFTTLFHYMF